MDVIDVIVLCCIMATLIVAYLQLVAMNMVVEEIQGVNIRMKNIMNHADSRENVLFEIIQNLDTSLQENTEIVKTLVYEDDQEDEVDEKNGGIFF